MIQLRPCKSSSVRQASAHTLYWYRGTLVLGGDLRPLCPEDRISLVPHMFRVIQALQQLPKFVFFCCRALGFCLPAFSGMRFWL